MKNYFLNQSIENLKGPSKEHIIFMNQWAAVALNKFHQNSTARLKLRIDRNEKEILLKWDSDFPSNAMREEIDMAHYGGVGMAFFVMSTILSYQYVEQSEIGDGVDYRFKVNEPKDDDLNFLSDEHYVEISGILKENNSNTLFRRIKTKHQQIRKGKKKNKTSSVIVTLFSEPITVKEIHK